MLAMFPIKCCVNALGFGDGKTKVEGADASPNL